MNIFTNKKTNISKWLVIFILSFPHIFHAHFPYGQISILEYSITRLRFISFIILLIIYFRKRGIRKPPLLLTILFFNDAFLVLASIINKNSSLNKSILYFFSSLSLALLIDIYSDDFEDLINGLLLNFEIQIYPNLITLLLYGNKPIDSIGYNQNLLFLGDKNDMILYFLPTIFLCLIYYFKVKKSKRVIILFISTIISLLISKCTTSIIAFCLCAGMLIVILPFYKKFYLNCIILLIIPIFIFMIVVFPYLLFGKNDIVNFLLNNVFYKHSFVSRTVIWQNSLNYILKKPLFGYGFNNSNIVLLDDINRVYICDGHNDIIQRLFNYGLIGLITYFIFNYIYIKRIDACKNRNIKLICTIITVFIYTVLIAEKYNRFFEFNIIFFVIYYITKQDSKS